jgi:8-hydroxy-5-deazaflavin:NADPH oxidoreductase
VDPLQIAVLGTGPVGRAVAARLAGLGHQVTIGTRDAASTAGRAEYAAWEAEHQGVALATFAEAAAGAELVVNAAGGDVSLDILERAGAEHLAGKVLLDISNPLDGSSGFPPRLFVQGDDSLAERIQRAHPEARVVKSLNTMNNRVMADPQRLGEETSVFVSGDDADAKALVTELLQSMGHGDVIDLGGLETARGAEMWLPLWVRLAVALGGSDFNIKVVRGPALNGGGGG